tara:strand:+ start:864 stop:1658 length:795 start_codon:yes stop_codon:yes gene_type:complete
MGLVLQNDTWTLQADGWEEVYSVDFADYTTGGVMSDSDTIEINGVTWTADGSGYGSVEVSPSSGLLITAGSNSDMYSSNFNIPRLYADVSDLVPDLSTRDVICMQWVQTYPEALPAASYEAAGAQFWNGATGGSWRGMGVRQIYTSGTRWCPFRGTNNELKVSIGATDEYNAFEVVWYFTGQAMICSSPDVDITALSAPLIMDSQRAYSNYLNSVAPTQTEANVAGAELSISNAKVMFYTMKVYSGNDFSGLTTKFRMFRLHAS